MPRDQSMSWYTNDMRKLVLIILIIALGFAYYAYTKNSIKDNGISDLSFQNQDEPPPLTSTIGPSDSIQSSFIIVKNTSKISLHPNFIDKLSVNEAKEKLNCTALVNGGFYAISKDEERIATPLGLFISDGNKLGNARSSTLFNGFFSVDEKPSITYSAPEESKNVIQTGPVLIKEGKTLTLSLARDENARRIVAAITEAGDIIFMTFYDRSSLASGPKLADVPKLVKQVSDDNNLEIKDAINLDGGNHSAFITEEVQLTDIATPGSYFCIKS